jgi:hypothetical protein
MPPSISRIWSHKPADPATQLSQTIDGASDHLSLRHPGFIFFRADDVAVPGNQFARMLEIFSRHRMPLCLALVPAWLTGPRWQHLKEIAKNTASLCCWHQHGWRHVHHEAEGKKQEFGPRRSLPALESDLMRGRDHLVRLIGEKFFPVFTPPWNRCDHRTLQLLEKRKYIAVSRSQGSSPAPPKKLPDFYVNVDLHTRKEADPRLGWKKLLQELSGAISSGFAGIMIHHQRMNDSAFDFLEMLVKNLARQKHLHPVDFKDLAEIKMLT